jgi:hypothetical protein
MCSNFDAAGRMQPCQRLLVQEIKESGGAHKGRCLSSQAQRRPNQIESSRVESGRSSWLVIERLGSMGLDSNTCFQFPFDFVSACKSFCRGGGGGSVGGAGRKTASASGAL